MTASSPISGKAILSGESGNLRKRDGEPLFAEPWQAECMALVARLVEQGRIGAGEWAAALGEEIRRAATAGAPDNAESYYAAALRALERLVIAGGLVGAEELAARKQAWTEAYESTPHGQSVKLPMASP